MPGLDAAAAPDAPVGHADAREVRFAGSRIDAFALCAGCVLRTSEPERVEFGLAQVRRLLVSPSLRALHVVFAPSVPRPLLLGLVRLENTSAEALGVAGARQGEGASIGGSYVRRRPAAGEAGRPTSTLGRL